MSVFCLQIQFNEAITRAVQEKDHLIEELKAQLDRMAAVGECPVQWIFVMGADLAASS